MQTAYTSADNPLAYKNPFFITFRTTIKVVKDRTRFLDDHNAQ